MYIEVCSYFKAGEDCQRMSVISTHFSRLKAHLTRRSENFSVDFARTLSTTSRRIVCLYVSVEHLTGWPLAHPSWPATASEVNAFIERHIIRTFGRPRLVLSYTDPSLIVS